MVNHRRVILSTLLLVLLLVSVFSPALGAGAVKESIDVTNGVPKVGPYSQLIRAGGFVFASAQVAFDPETGKLIDGDVAAQTCRILDNFEAELLDAGLTLDNAVKATVYLKDMANFDTMNEVYAEHFSEPYPVRSCVQVSDFPVEGAEIMIDLIFVDAAETEK